MIRVTLRHRFPAATLDIAFEAPTPATTVLFGPSGAGKTSVVAAVAGLIRPEFLRVEMDGTVLADTETGIWVPPERRRIGMVFQDARLFPHMNVASNLRYGLRRAPHGPIGFDEVVDLLGIARLLSQRPHTLSGGERQRVAIGRALLSQPRLLLMDEPLAGLDGARKAEILPFLIRLKTAMKLPILYVTHALDELGRLADAIVLIEAGRVTAAGSLSEITAKGATSLAARDDAGVVLQLDLAGHDENRQLSHLRAHGFQLVTTRLDPMRPPTPVRVRIAARDVILARAIPDEISVHNLLQGQVRAIIPDHVGNTALVEVQIGAVVILARITQDAVTRMQLAPGGPVVALVKSSSVEVLG